MQMGVGSWQHRLRDYRRLAQTCLEVQNVRFHTCTIEHRYVFNMQISGRFVISVVAFWQLVWQSEGTLREC
ncbi:hypothetical protein T4D_9903 [Trichinella pseudospiralis]|uniref:Uncharacterized protein n=1 Tax=Trichinella pseudospiralis TaxID=6337 RepID=A0A0V1G1G2_TRIPS|nr:hypothetical protein T4D_9903 [Trichinella pseudospiralis]